MQRTTKTSSISGFPKTRFQSKVNNLQTTIKGLVYRNNQRVNKYRLIIKGFIKKDVSSGMRLFSLFPAPSNQSCFPAPSEFSAISGRKMKQSPVDSHLTGDCILVLTLYAENCKNSLHNIVKMTDFSVKRVTPLTENLIQPNQSSKLLIIVLIQSVV